MDIGLDRECEAFREEVRTFIAREWRAAMRDDREAVKTFRTAAIDRGFLYRNVPRAYGGSEQPADSLKSSIVKAEFAAAGAVGEAPGVGVTHFVPTLLAFGTEWQKQRFVRATLMGELVWCQGYSEPTAGSDLASLRTRAELAGEAWVINGHKIWTSHAHRADFMFLLARTEKDQPGSRGVSYLLLDMKSPGIRVSPLRQMNGESEFNEVVFEDVRTPADWIVGKRGEGWKVSRTTLVHERANVGQPDMMEALIARLRSLAESVLISGAPAIRDAGVREKLGVIEGYALAQRYSVMRQTSMLAAGQDPGLAALTNKLVATDLGLRIADLAQELIGADGMLMPAPGVTRENMDWPFWNMRAMAITIAGGTSNIQRNIIAERGLGLPRETAATS